jgi:hypothetical protein
VGGSQPLLGAAVERFGPTQTWPRQLMAAPDAPEQLASFAPVVSAAAEGQPAGTDVPVAPDPVAADICRRAGRGLAEALVAAAAGLDEPTLVASGGVLAAPAVRAALVRSLDESGRELSPAHGGALDGTLILGRRLVEAGSLPEHPAYLLVANA